MDCVGPSGTLLILAAKPHQKSCTNIGNFVWMLCVSYRSLNGVTPSLEFHIPRYLDSIEDFGDSYGKLYFIFLDARYGFHQIRVREYDQNKSWLSLPPKEIRNIIFWN